MSNPWTPGPWWVETEPYIHIRSDAGCVLAADYATPANSTLIASAPALVEALEKITIYRVEDDDRLWLKVNGVVICAILDDGHSDDELAALARFDAESRAALSLAKGTTQGETR